MERTAVILKVAAELLDLLGKVDQKHRVFRQLIGDRDKTIRARKPAAKVKTKAPKRSRPIVPGSAAHKMIEKLRRSSQPSLPPLDLIKASGVHSSTAYNVLRSLTEGRVLKVTGKGRNRRYALAD